MPQKKSKIKIGHLIDGQKYHRRFIRLWQGVLNELANLSKQ